jgi:hypothetical protein
MSSKKAMSLMIEAANNASLKARSTRKTLRIQFARIDLVHVAPHPRLARLNRAHQRMMHSVEVFGRMFVLGRVAAADMTALQAEPQMDPGVAHLDALRANVSIGFGDLDGVEMIALVRHNASTD